MADDLTALKVINSRDQARTNRLPWDTEWQEIGDLVYQRKNSITIEQSKGNNRTVRVYDTTAGQALEDYVMGIWTFLFQGRWIQLESTNRSIKDLDVVRQFWGEVASLLLEQLATSNFDQQSVEALYDHGGFGTMCFFAEEGKDTLFNFKTIPVGNFYIIENNKGIADVVIFDFEFTARQAVDEWGEENVHDNIKKDLGELKAVTTSGGGKTQEKKYKFIQMVSPRNHFDSTKLDKLNKPIASFIVDETNKVVVNEGGFDEMPLMTPRFQKSNTEIYGRSPAKRMMPTIKMVNRMEKTSLKAHEKEVDPPVIMPHDTANTYGISTDPGGRIYYDGRNPLNKPEPFKINARIQEVEVKIDRKRAEIKAAFFGEMFDALGDRKNMTATEVLERIKKQIILFIPIFGRLAQEYLNPLVDRLIGIAFRAGALPPIPDEVQFAPDFNVIFNNRITTLIKLLENESLTLTMEQLGPLFQAFPQMLDNFDADAMARGISTNNNLPEEFLLNTKVRDERRAAIAEDRERQAQLETVKETAELALKS